MKKELKRLISFLLVAVLTVGVFTYAVPTVQVDAASADALGSNITWELSDDGTLTVSGTGDMKDNDNYSNAWGSDGDRIKKVIINEGVTSVGNSIFNSLENLESVTMPEGLTRIGNTAFGWCYKLSKVKMPSTVEMIDIQAFVSCNSLAKIEIPDGVRTIGEDAFSSCFSIKEINIPKSVESIGANAFSGFSVFSEEIALTAINVDADNKNYSSIDGVLFNKEQTELICFPDGKAGAYTVPDSVKSINERAFDYANRITEVKVGNGTETIGREAFVSNVSLKSVPLLKMLNSADLSVRLTMAHFMIAML